MNCVTKTCLRSSVLENTSLAFAFSYLKIDKQLGYQVQYKLCLGMSHDVTFICLVGRYRPSYQAKHLNFFLNLRVLIKS